MWLWKKFWNTDIVGKTYILIILFIVIVATITIITRYNNANTNQVLNEQHNEVIQDAVQTEQIQEEVTAENIIDIAQTQESIEKEIITDKPKVEKQEKSVLKTNKEDNKNTAQTETKEEVKHQETEDKIEPSQEQQDTNKQEEKQETEEKKETTSQEVVREVRKNDTYIQKMKEYITTNDKSSYSIIVDSSIVNNTYGFTYSEFNMSGYIGCYSVYRIYAQDYYVNGEFVETRCYID